MGIMTYGTVLHNRIMFIGKGPLIFPVAFSAYFIQAPVNKVVVLRSVIVVTAAAFHLFFSERVMRRQHMLCAFLLMA